MKALNTVILISLFIFPGGLPLKAQDINYERMDRDIRIMENVLSEMLKTNINGNGQNGNYFSFGTKNDNVQGTYIPGYGVILKHETGTSYIVRTTATKEEVSGYSYSFSGSRGSVTVNKETIKDRMIGFLKDYAPTIGQLGDNDNIMVIYRSHKSRPYAASARIIVNGMSNEDAEVEEIPTISVSVKKSDLNAFKRGRLSEEALMQRMSVSESEDQEYLDLKILSNILETALSDTGPESFQVRGNVGYILLDNFGALYNMDLRYGNNRFGAVTIRDERVREVLRETVVEGVNISSPEEAEKNREERVQKMQDALEQLKTDLKEYLVDYGSTLSSVESEQYVMLSANLNQVWMREGDFPSRLVIQVSKSVLDRANSGSLSREDAMEQVQVMEY